MQVLILGCGELVQHIAPALIGESYQVIILDEHQRCPSPTPHYPGAETVPSTGVLMEDLQRCEIDDVDAFLALSEDDNQNAMAAQIASHIFSVPKVICHVGNPSKNKAYKTLGLNVVSSTATVSENILLYLKDLG